MRSHIKIQKTIKLFIDGKFPRTESGRSYACLTADGTTHYANLCQASRKDVRMAVEVAQKAGASWTHATAFNRSQILYRMAEMAEGKRVEFVATFKDVLGWNDEKANEAVDAGIDTLVYFAGWADKYQQVTSAVNPVAGPHHNFTAPDPMGVVGLLCADQFDFSKLLADICGIIASGNAVVVLLGKGCPAVLAPLSEVFATSDLPAGVVNLLTGHLLELAEHFGSHMEIRAISFQNEDDVTYHKIKKLGVDNMKRVTRRFDCKPGLKSITDFVEYKTVWHPIGQ